MSPSIPIPKNLTRKVLIAGGLLVDDVATAAESIRHQSSNPVTWRQKLGGVATNVARVVTQQLSAPYKCQLVANIGSDANGENLAKCLDECAIDHTLATWESRSSDRYSAILNPDGELYVGLSHAELVEKMQWSDIEAALPIGKLLDQPIDKPTNTPTEQLTAVVLDANLTEQCLTQTVEGIRTSYEERVPIYALAVSPFKALRWQGLATQVDVLLCNRREAAALASLPVETDINHLADVLHALGFKSFVLTDANNPILVQEQDLRVSVAVPTITITHNVNGAGDAMAGATIAQIVTGQTLADAVQGAGLKSAKAVLLGDACAPSL